MQFGSAVVDLLIVKKMTPYNINKFVVETFSALKEFHVLVL